MQASTVENPTVKFATMLSGGSLASWSVTWSARTTNVQLSPQTKSASGSIVNVVGPPLTAAVCVPLSEQESVYQAPVTFTASVNVTVTFVSTGTLEAPSAGTVLATAGAASGGGVLRGFGAPIVKSALLLSVSCAPFDFRSAAVVFERLAVGARLGAVGRGAVSRRSRRARSGRSRSASSSC